MYLCYTNENLISWNSSINVFMKRLIVQKVIVLLYVAFATDTKAQEYLNSYRLSVTTPSYIYNIYRGNLDDANKTEHFKNKYFTFNYHLKKISINVGIVRNSTNDRVIVLGITKRWLSLSKTVSFSSDLAYAGNFFFPYFSEADDGFYKFTKKKLGIAFAPYIANYLSIRLSKRCSINTGLMAPFTFFATLSFDIVMR